MGRKGLDRNSKEIVAIKCIDKKSLNTAEELAIPQREIQALKKLSHHPNAIRLLDWFENEKHYFLVFEYVRKGTLADWLARQPMGLPEPDAKSVIRQIASAIYHVHSHGLVHVDITPRNVLIDEGGVVKLGDFGFALDVRAADVSERTGMRGTLHYASPEMRRGEEFDKSTDVWSLGIVAHETLTGMVPPPSSLHPDGVVSFSDSL